MISGVDLEEKFRLARTTPWIDCRTLVSVIVFPDPGGPLQRKARIDVRESAIAGRH
jgi:hypothetical protein